MAKQDKQNGGGLAFPARSKSSYKVVMQDVGRSKAHEEKTFDRPPEYEDLYAMAAKHLCSSYIDFAVMEETESRTAGHVIVGGWRSVGSFSIEKEEGEARV